MTKTMNAGDIFTVQEVEAAQRIMRRYAGSESKNRIQAEIIEPIMGRINKVTGQQNDAGYMAYMIQHVVNSLPKD